jgi:hypothetical protein
MRHREDEVQLVPADVLHLVDRGRHLRVDDLGLADATKALASSASTALMRALGFERSSSASAA